MDNPTTESKLKTIAVDVGFDECRIVEASDASSYPLLVHWLDSGFAGTMEYIRKRQDAYQNPNRVMSNANSILMLISSYHAEADSWDQQSTYNESQSDVGQVTRYGQVARYAASGVDYHDILHLRMKLMIAAMKKSFPDDTFRGVVDSAPLLEREFAQRAGMGWVGKNTMLISRKWGSYFFLSAILTSLKLNPDARFESDHCGTCTACLEACPTHAFVEPRVLDANKCISYLTIEHRSAASIELRPLMQDWVFGCDICQEVCPWNRKAVKVNNILASKPALRAIDIAAILEMTEPEFRLQYRKTPLWRSRLSGLKRNALISLFNQDQASARRWAAHFRDDEDRELRTVAHWILDAHDSFDASNS